MNEYELIERLLNVYIPFTLGGNEGCNVTTRGQVVNLNLLEAESTKN